MTIQINSVVCNRGRKGFDAEIQYRVNPFTPEEKSNQVVIGTGYETRAAAGLAAEVFINDILSRLEKWPRAQE